jgi:hypothetical protein
MTNKQKYIAMSNEVMELNKVRHALLKAMASCGEITSTAAFGALLELVVDTGIAVGGSRERCVQCISDCVNVLMARKYQRHK